MHLSRFPRVRLAHCPTPLEPMDSLSRHLGGPKLYVKRDDCTGLATGGNKTRKLEFLMGEALAQGCDTVLTEGATQSNHVRQTAAAAAKLGLKCHALLEHRIEDPDDDYALNGNILLDHLLGAEIHDYPADTDMNAALADVAAEVRRAGGKPYVIPAGGSNRVGALGYVSCALEILNQANEMGVRIDHVVHATGSNGTQAGFVVGFEGANSDIPVTGICVSKTKELQEELCVPLADETAELVGVRGGIQRQAIVANDQYTGPGYGQPTEGMREAVHLMATHEAILLDPVYSGKAMSGLVDLIRKGIFTKDQTVLFVHTGGAAAMFAYRKVFG
jgi:L-cysteate sulfo-lyase